MDAAERDLQATAALLPPTSMLSSRLRIASSMRESACSNSRPRASAVSARCSALDSCASAVARRDSVESQTRFTQASMQINGQLQNQHQSEMEQRQRAAAAMSQWALQQQAIAAQQQAIDVANRPRTINLQLLWEFCNV